MDLDSNPDVLAVRKHLVEHLGAPDEVHEVRGSPLPSSPVQALQLAYFAPGGPEAPVVFATNGACLFRMKDGRRVEAMMLFRRQPPPVAQVAIQRLLSSFALFSEANDEAIRVGDVVQAPAELRDFSAMDAIIFLPPVPFVESFHRIPLGKDREAEMIWLLPIYEAEAKYALEHGPQALMMLFAAQGLDLTSPEREEANTIIAPQDAQSLAERRSGDDKKRQAPAAPKPAARRGAVDEGQVITPGAVQLAEEGGAVTVVRRGVKPTKPKTEPNLRALPPAEAPPEEPPAPSSPPPRRRPVVAVVPKKEEPIRFDLASGKQIDQKKGPPTPTAKPAPPKPAPQPAPKAPPPPVKESPEEAKKRRVEELKAKAAEAAKRAAERQGQSDPSKG